MTRRKDSVALEVSGLREIKTERETSSVTI